MRVTVGIQQPVYIVRDKNHSNVKKGGIEKHQSDQGGLRVVLSIASVV